MYKPTHPSSPARVGYVVKRYPRYSETFIVNEILAHERAGLAVEVFALRPPSDTHFQAAISLVRAPVTYLSETGKMTDLWNAVRRMAALDPEAGARLADFGEEDVRDVYQAMQLARLVRERGITHLHAHFATSATSVARMASLLAGIPYTFTAHAKDIFHESVDPADLTRKLRDAAGVVTVSAFNLRFLREQYGAHAGGVTRIYNGLDLDVFPYDAPVGRKPIIAAAGRLVEKKGFDDLIDACAVLVDEGVDFECLIAGGGEQEADLRRRIADRRLGDYVRLLGPLPLPSIVELVRSAAVFAAPCVVGRDGNRDGPPTVLLEAMALGTPIVSTDVTGIPEILTDRETGLMVGQRRPNELADAMHRLLENEAFRVRISRQARTLIEERFDIHRNAAAIRSLFEQAAYARDHAMAEVAA